MEHELLTKQDILNMGFREDEVTFFRNPSYNGCILGLSHDNRPIYSFSAMAEYLIENKICDTEEDARDYVDHDTIRSLEYLPGDKYPIVLID